MARKNKQKWEYEEENYYGVRPSNSTKYQKPRRNKKRSAAEDELPVDTDFDEK